MKRYSKEEMDDLLKEKSDQYLLYPSDRVWRNIQKELHPNNNWRYLSLSILFFFVASVSIHVKKNEVAKSNFVEKQNLYEYISTPSSSLDKKSLKLPTVEIPDQNPVLTLNIASVNQLAERLSPAIKLNQRPQVEVPKSISSHPQILVFNDAIPEKSDDHKDEKKYHLSETIDLVVKTAKNIGKNISWQFYGGPSLSYRNLKGQATRNIYQYAVYSLSTNAVFARDVKDVVNHKPAMGFEFGTAMVYPLTKKINLKTGLQANYNQYQINAYSTAPEIATYSMNNQSGNLINAVSLYRSSSGLSPAKIQNEHYMISLPIGIEYEISGTDRLNFSVGSSIQPTYVFANYSYLLSSNLKNYAKEPSLNRNWNINGAIEASINFQQKGYRWSIAPQFRYQLLSSFKDKYPIKENLMDMGIKVGIIKTIN